MSGQRRLSEPLYAPLRGTTIASRKASTFAGTHHTRYAASLTLGARTRTAPLDASQQPRLAKNISLAAPASRSTSSLVRNLRHIAVVGIASCCAALVLLVVGAPVTPGGGGQLWTVLITGLTTGGLSCMAVQGGLLASTLKPSPDAQTGQDPVRIVVAFLAAKLAAYTMLGALLGAFGSVMQLSVTSRGVMQIAIGLFMVANAVRMIKPYRWLRFFALEPPASVRRLIRRVSRQDDDASTPIFLGALTVLIPCGVTQAMMAVAITTASPIAGALVMALFTIGTSPVFLTLVVAATTMGRGLDRIFNRLVAVLILILGYVAIQTGANLVGHPLPIRPLFVGMSPATQTSPAAHAGPVTDGVTTVEIRVLENGYAPDQVSAPPGVPLKLRLRTSNVTGCTRSFTIPKLNIQRPLEVDGLATVSIPAQDAGTSLGWVCGMGMYRGTISYDEEPG